MRIEQVWDKWMLTDEDGFYSGIDPKAPDDVKEAYEKYLDEQKKAESDGYIAK